MDSKSIFRSRTFWFAVLKGAAGAALATLHPNPTVKAIGGGTVATSLAEIGLRMLTNAPVSLP